MSDEIAFRLTGDSSGLTAEFEKLHGKITKIVGDLTETAKGAKKYGDEHGKALRESQVEMDKLARAAEKWKRQVDTPADEHKRNLKELQILYRMGKITLEEYTRAADLSSKQSRMTSLAAIEAKATSLSAIQEIKETGSAWSSTGKQALTILGTYASMSTIMGGLSRGINLVREANRQWQADAEKTALAYDKMFRQFSVQAGLRGIESESAKKSILNEAGIAGVTAERATSAATALVSAGVKPEDASQGALREVLGLLNAQGLSDQDPQQFVQSMVQYLGSQGKEVNQGTLRELAVQIQSQPVQETLMKLTDLTQLSQVGASLQGKLTQEEQVAAFAKLGSIETFPVAATKMQDIFKNLSIAGGKSDASKAIESMGMKPEDIDFQGEGFETVMGRLGAGLQRLPVEQRDIALGKIVEGTNIGSTKRLMAMTPEIVAMAQGVNDPAKLDADTAFASQGPNRALIRQQLKRETALAAENEQGSLIRGEIAGASIEAGESPALRSVRETVFDTIRSFGFGTQTATVGAQSITKPGEAIASLGGGFGATAAGAAGDVFGTLAGGVGTGIFGQLVSLQVGQREAADIQIALQERMASSLDQIAANANPNAKPNATPPGKPAAADRAQTKPGVP